MVMKDAFAILRADKQLQSSIHDFALCFQAREFFRLADQGFVNVDVSASHKPDYTPILAGLVYPCGRPTLLQSAVLTERSYALRRVD